MLPPLKELRVGAWDPLWSDVLEPAHVMKNVFDSGPLK